VLAKRRIGRERCPAPWQEVVRRYGLAILAVAVTATARFVAESALAGRAGWIAFILPVALAALRAGRSPVAGRAAGSSKGPLGGR
jgi:hypothetical protein